MKANPSRKVKGTSQPQAVEITWTPPEGFVVPIPKDEEARLADLLSYKLLDTLPEEELDNLTRLAATICETPIALLSLVDSDRQWFKSKVGVTISETSRHVAICAHAIMQRDLFVVPDASKDKRFATNPLVTSAPKIRFYAGAPLVTADNHALGTLCVIDRVPRVLTRRQTEALGALSRQIMARLETRRELTESQLRLLRSRRSQKNLQRTLTAVESASVVRDEFLVKAGHALRTTLGGMLAITKQMQATRLTPKQQQLLRTLRSETASMIGLANELAPVPQEPAPSEAPSRRGG